MRKIIFLDIDGVVNSSFFFKTQPDKDREHDIDPKAVEILQRILKETGAEVVLSSSWRGGEENHKVIRNLVCDFTQITPRCCAGIRGVEIYTWIDKNIPYDEKDQLKYAILDDDSDMLLWQKDHFFQCDNEFGLTEEIANNVINHLNK